ncbi:MAG TPA: glycosyltransferase [Bradyrhizobium sp.]|nr:glycosyltransferase [Bradyrhizobium sp.]
MQDYAPLPNPTLSTSARKPRICIATWEIEGPSRNGGIGTAYLSLAEASRRAGHEVTVLYLLGSFCANGNIIDWADKFRDQKGITLVPLPLPPTPRIHAAWASSVSYHAYNWLKEAAENFDIVHFPECQGIGFYSMLAKRQGIAFQNCTFVISTHGPTFWVKESSQDFLNNLGELEIDHLERVSVAAADHLTSPSRYLLGWIRSKGWALPPSVYIAPYILPENITHDDRQSVTVHRGIREFVFFGRLELRKGLKLFCDAVDELSLRYPDGGFEVTFLGKETLMFGRSSIGYLSDRSRRWTMPWHVIANRGQAGAMAYLKKPGRMAVISSLVDNYPNTVLECIGGGVPFIAAAVGGIPEIIAAEDHANVCFSPDADALAARLERVLEQGAYTARPAQRLGATEESWVNWHQSLLDTAPPEPTQANGEQPLVSLCFPYDVRKGMHEATLATLLRQTYRNLEILLVECGGAAEADESALEVPPGCRKLRRVSIDMGAARNAALAAARGGYVMFVDDNTLLENPDAISIFIAVAARTGADIVTSTISFYLGSSDNRIEHSRRPFLGGDAATGAFVNSFGSSNALMRREIFTRIGGFSPGSATTLDDWEIFSKAVLAGLAIETIPEPLIWYREDEEADAQVHSYANAIRSIRPYTEPGRAPVPGLESILAKSLLLAQGLKFERDIVLGTSLARGEQGPAVTG